MCNFPEPEKNRQKDELKAYDYQLLGYKRKLFRKIIDNVLDVKSTHEVKMLAFFGWNSQDIFYSHATKAL